MGVSDCKPIAMEAFETIRLAFPHLRMEQSFDDPYLDVSVDIPKQKGLDFDVNLNLQNVDELYLEAGGFWNSWFPCTDSKRVQGYVAAVCGLLSGDFRILEYRRKGRAVKAQLQRQDGAKWRTIATSACGWVFWPLRSTMHVIQNTSAPGLPMNTDAEEAGADTVDS